MLKRITIFMLIFLLVISSYVSAATVTGSIYDSSLDLLPNTVLTINSTPEQTFVSKDGTFTFTLSPGTYYIRAAYNDKGTVYVDEQEFSILDDGDYVLDMILFPDISDSDELLDEDVVIPDVTYSEKGFNFTVLGIVLAALIIGIIILIVLIKKQRKRINKFWQLDEESQKVLMYIKKEGGRTTQKEIRKNFPQSEAKISLIIADLEDKNYLHKIKKGKGNIIILNRK